jgi:hypothetical protein
MNRKAILLTLAVVALGLPMSACNSSGSGGQAASSTSSTSAAQLTSLIPTPANNQMTKGPDTIPDNGVHLHYQVNGAPGDVMNAFKTALQGKGWAVTTIVTSGGGGGGGATYTGTHDSAFAVFDGGGYNTTTYIDVCTWPAKPANPNCTRGGQ